MEPGWFVIGRSVDSGGRVTFDKRVGERERFGLDEGVEVTQAHEGGPHHGLVGVGVIHDLEVVAVPSRPHPIGRQFAAGDVDVCPFLAWGGEGDKVRAGVSVARVGVQVRTRVSSKR